MGKGDHQVNCRELYYDCQIPEIDDGTLFHVIWSNFKVDTCAILPLEDKVLLTAPMVEPAAQEDVNDQLILVDDVTQNIHDELSQEIAELHDDNEPALENAKPPPQATSRVGELITPTVCPRREANCSNSKGYWKRFARTVVSGMNEFA
ncbi:hypothetical protein ACHAW6_009788 [Cyclotella cf. meneghiniana]